LLRDQEPLEKAVELMTLRFGVHTCGARLAEVDDEGSEVGPDVFSVNKRHCLVLTEVSREYMIMFVLKYLESEVASLEDVYSTIESEETIVSVRPSWVAHISEVFLS